MAPLHPRRVEKTLSVLEEVARENERQKDDVIRKANAEMFETELAALRLIQKAQQATGITGNVADMGAALLSFMRAAWK